jgi:nitrogen fixation NifU-like protein
MSETPYRERVLDHYQNPRHRGHLASPDRVGEADNPICGDRVRLELSLDEEGHVVDAAFTGDGCIICLASASMLAELAHGMHTDELEELDEQGLLEIVGVELGRARRQCALVALQSLRAALAPD